MNTRGLANIAYAAARGTKGQQMGVLFMALASAATERRMRDFNTQDLANTAWAFAMVGHGDERLFTALAAAAVQRLKDFNSQALANTAWAFATQ